MYLYQLGTAVVYLPVSISSSIHPFPHLISHYSVSLLSSSSSSSSPTLTVFQLSDAVADGVDALVDLLVLALRLLPHGLALLLQHLYLPLQLPLQVLHPPGALSTPGGALRWGLGGGGSGGDRTATPWGSRCRWGGSTAGGQSRSLAGVTSWAAAAATVAAAAATWTHRCVCEVQGSGAYLRLQEWEREHKVKEVLND